MEVVREKEKGRVKGIAEEEERVVGGMEGRKRGREHVGTKERKVE